MIPNDAVWLITGCSSGFGRALAEAALRQGYRVAATARDVARVEALVQKAPDRCTAIALDINDRGQVARSVAAVNDRFGRVDILVNNAGNGLLAGIEEASEEEIRAQLETNFFGLVAMTQATLPGMRARRSGHIVNVASIGGLVGMASVGYYNASKFAVAGFSEALAEEAADIGVGVTIVEPGGFRTEWAGSGMAHAKRQIDGYPTVEQRLTFLRSVYDREPGDPAKAATAIIEALKMSAPPLHLVLGVRALDTARRKLGDLQSQFEQYEHLSRSTEFAVETAR